LRSTIDVPIPIDQPAGASPQILDKAQTSPTVTPIENKSINIDFSMQISKKSELVELLKIFQNQINTIKNTIDNLINTTIESRDDVIEFPLKEASDPQIETQIDPTLEEPPKKPVRLPKLESGKVDTKEVVKNNSKLTTLPPKPESLKTKEPEESLESDLASAPKLKTKGKVKKDLKDEKQGLESKLSSVEDLLKFVDKKHSSGKIDDEEYSKRSKKIQKDIKKTNKRLSVIDKLLDK
jgi:hypothetical protein